MEITQHAAGRDTMIAVNELIRKTWNSPLDTLRKHTPSLTSLFSTLYSLFPIL